MKKKKKRKKYERVKGLNYFIYARLNGFAEIAEWSVEKAARKDGASWIEENPAWLQHGGRKGGGWRRFNEGSLSRLYAPPIQFFFLSPPPRRPPSVMRAIAPLARLSSAPTLATLILSTTEAITYAKRREREEEATSHPRLERDWVPEAISRPFFDRPDFSCLWEKKEEGRKGMCMRPGPLISFRVNAGNPGLLEGCSPSFKKDFVRKWIIPPELPSCLDFLSLSLSFFGFIKRFILSTRESKSLIFFFFFHNWTHEEAWWEYLLSNVWLRVLK